MNPCTTFAFRVKRAFNRAEIHNVTFHTPDSVGTVQLPTELDERRSDSVNPNVLEFAHVFVMDDGASGP